MSLNSIARLDAAMIRMRDMANKVLRQQLGFKTWEPVTIIVPRRINGRWYGPGARVYRYHTLSPGGGFWTYGDEFDILKEQ